VNVLDEIVADQIRSDLPELASGDTVKVSARVVEGGKERIQVFEGTVLRRSGAGVRETFTVRKTSYGVGVERTFPVHSPRLDRIEITAKGAVRRAKLYYLRERAGRAARVTEEVTAGSVKP
jgi:large subunit ribosomal protein L19